MRGRIDGTDVYLSEDQLPEFTVSIDDVLDPSSIKGTRSTTTELIRTPELARAMGSEYMAEQPRNDRPTLRIGDDSVDLFSVPVVPISRSRTSYSVIAIGGNASWFEYAKTKRIRDHAWGDTDQISTADQVASWTDLDALVYYSLIDFGAISQPPSSNVISDNLRPALRAHRISGDLMAERGWTVTPKGELADHWKKLLIIDPKAKFTIPIPSFIPWTQLADNSGFNPDGVYFVPTADGTMSVELDGVTFSIDDPTNPEFDGVEFVVVVYDFTDRRIVAQQSIGSRFFGDPDYGTRVINATFTDVEAINGHQYYVGIQAMALDDQERTITIAAGFEDNPDPVPDVLLASITYDLNSGAQVLSLTRETDGTMELTDQESEGSIYTVGMRLRMAKMMPDWTLIRLIQAVSNALCMRWVTNDQTRTIEAWYDREYFRKPTRSTTTRDWTDRLDITEAPERIDPAKPKVLSITWAADEEDLLLRRHNRALGTSYGSTRLEFDNAYGAERTIDIPFAPTAMATGVNGLRIPVARQFDDMSGGSNYERPVRLLVDGGLRSGSWSLNGVSQTQYPFAYFAWDDAEVVLPTDNVNVYGVNEPVSVNTNWKRRLDELRYARVLECSVMLRDHEIRDFDHGMPTLLDDGSGPRWYYVQEIQGHRFGRREPTRVRLVEIPGAQLATRPLVNRVPVEYPVAVVFQCVGTGNATFVATDTIGFTIRTSTGYVTLRNNATGVETVYGSGADIAFSVEGVTAGTYCMWSSNAEGGRSGVITHMADTEAEMTGLTIDRLTSIQEYSGTAPANDFDYSPLTALTYLGIAPGAFTGTSVDVGSSPLTYLSMSGSSNLETVTPPSAKTLQLVDFENCALDATSVQAIIEACDAAHPNGALVLVGGTNASPSAEGMASISKLEIGANMEVSGARTAIANGEYELIGTANGRNSYDKVGGGPNISWDGSKWVLSTTSGSYKAEEDVAEPWMATNWTTFGASAPAPSLTPPYAGGWVVFTN